MKQRLRYLLLPIITLILEVLPFGAVCVFASSPTERIRQTFSYFDLAPFGYANFSPLFTAITTCLILLLLMIYFFTGEKVFAEKARNILWVCIVFSLQPLLLGIEFFSLVGLLISLSLIGEVVLLRQI